MCFHSQPDLVSNSKRINKSLERNGRVFEFRYHSTPLTSPHHTRNARSYVLNNWRRHREDERGLAERTMVLDPYSSAIAFSGWADFRLERSAPEEQVGLLDDEPPLYVASPQTWLLNKGWELARRPIRTSDTPGPLD